MATYTVNPAGGGDYTTLEAAYNAHGGNNTYVLYSGNCGTWTPPSNVPSGTIVYAAAGYEADPDDGITSNAYLTGISLGIAGTIEGSYTGFGIYAAAAECIKGRGGGTWRKCMFWSNAGGSTYAVYVSFYKATILRNCWIRSAGNGVYMWQAGSRIQNCTIRGSGAVGVYSANAGSRVYNTAVLGFTGGFDGSAAFAVLHNNIDTTATVGTVTCSDRADNQASVDEADVCIDPTNWDLDPKPGGLADGTGENLTAIITDDFYGNPRPATGAWTVGFMQLAASGGPFPHYTRRRMAGGMIPMGIG